MKRRQVQRLLRRLEKLRLIVPEICLVGRQRCRGYRVLVGLPRLANLQVVSAGEERGAPPAKGRHFDALLPMTDGPDGCQNVPGEGDKSGSEGRHFDAQSVRGEEPDTEGGGKEALPPARRAAPPETPTTGNNVPARPSAPTNKPAPQPRLAGRLAALAQEIVRRQTRPESVDVVLAILAEDLHLGRYRLRDMEDFLAGLPKVDAHAYRFREVVPGVAASVRQGRLVARLREVQERKLFSAWRQGPDGNRIEAVVDFVDFRSPGVHLREFIQTARGPFPGERITLTSLDELAAWTFVPEQGKLFALGEPPAKAVDSTNAADLARAPDPARPGDPHGPQVQP